MHLRDADASPSTWLSLGLLFLVYPHAQFWRASTSHDPLVTEMHNLWIDAVLLGVAVAAFGFPLWISFSAMLGALSNSAANRGWRGVVESLLAFAAGALLAAVRTGFSFTPETRWPVALFCMVGVTGYLLAMNDIGFKRNLQLRTTRQKLRLREKALLSANDALQQNLLEIDALRKQLEEQANRDPMTGLYNRRYLGGTLDRELARCKREGKPLALILIDLDNFKAINDTYGHQAGDKVLIQFAALLGSLARAGDVACRYGGEEFLLLMPTMPLLTAQERAEELRKLFELTVVEFGDFRLRTTISIGISVYPGHATTADDLIRNADAALYQAKTGGRNQVVVAANPH